MPQQHHSNPLITPAKLAALYYLRLGGVKEPMSLAVILGLRPEQVERIRSILPFRAALNSKEHYHQLRRPVRCTSCGGSISLVPCVVCHMAGKHPSYDFDIRARSIEVIA